MRFKPLLFVSLLLMGCSKLCANEDTRVFESPTGKLKAVVFSRNCGATTGANTQVSILSLADSLPDEPGNTFISNGSPPISLRWQADELLEIRGVGSLVPIKQQTKVNGVIVSYAP